MDEKTRIIEELQKENKILREQNSLLQQQVKVLLGRIAELERRLGLNSKNSSKPPSSEGLGKPRVKSLREEGTKESGGQKGHLGETLKKVSEPDHILLHSPTHCSGCYADLSGIAPLAFQARQVFDLPVPSIEVTEHRAEQKLCLCGCLNTVNFPDGVNAPVQYGERIRALSVYFNHQQLIPEDRVRNIFQDLFQISITPASIASYGAKAYDSLKIWLSELQSYLSLAPVKHLDETGFRIAGSTQWLHVMSDPYSTCYRATPKRGEMFPDLCGIVIHDHFKPYFSLQGVSHGLCNAHHLRELKALIEIEKEIWASRMARLLRFANRHPEHRDRIRKIYDIVLSQGFLHHEKQPSLTTGKRGRKKRRIGHNLLLRLQKHKDSVLRFLDHEDVPFTNNQAEQDIRMMKVRMKISGSFRSMEGARAFAAIRSFTSTCRKRGVNIFHAIQGIFQGSLPDPCYSPA